MNQLKVLDCTLRDGGYVNGWNFGKENIKKIIRHLTAADIDLIECGFLKDNITCNPDKTLFSEVADVKNVLPANKKNVKFVCMINLGEYNPDALPPCDGTSIDGIRVTFHKKDKKEALELCRKIVQKGYLLFMQPMVTINYSDRELLELVEESSAINPYAFYIVDSFGVMRKNDLLRIFYLVDNNLQKDIRIGYHSHNNLQLAFSNAQSLIEIHTKRGMIIDSSVFGMGRGAGNLNTELFVDHLNTYYGGSYKVYPLLQIIDETLNKAYSANYWGYSLPHYLSSIHNCHPNYASYLSNKNTLTIKSIGEILSLIPDGKKEAYDKGFIEDMYLSYQKHFADDADALQKLLGIFNGKTVVIVAPGKSIETYKEKIRLAIGTLGSISVSVNFIPDDFECNFAFFSNVKRHDSFVHSDKFENGATQVIVTSNIKSARKSDIMVNYSTYLNATDAVKDNSVLMLLKLLITSNARKVLFAGFDGYAYDTFKNYADQNMIFTTDIKLLEEMNIGIASVIQEYSSKIEMEFITPSKYTNISGV